MLNALKDTRPMPSDKVMSSVWSALRKGFLRHQVGAMTDIDQTKSKNFHLI